MALATIFTLQPVHATDSGTTQSNLSSSQQEDFLRSTILNYDGDTIDVLRNTYIISIDDHKDVDLTFDVSDTASKIKLLSIAEDGDILVPDTGRNTIVIATASGCTMCVTFIIATTTLHFLRRRKN